MEPPASMNGTNPHITASSRSSPAPALNRGRFSSRGLRRASFISPVTGERSKRIFTLREASHRSNGPAAHEGTPLLDGRRGRDEQSGRGFSLRNAVSAASYDFYGNACRKHLQSAWEFGRSKTGFGILKCSLAYLLGSLATFVPAISRLIGERQDSKHMVATVTVCCVWHPNGLKWSLMRMVRFGSIRQEALGACTRSVLNFHLHICGLDWFLTVLCSLRRCEIDRLDSVSGKYHLPLNS